MENTIGPANVGETRVAERFLSAEPVSKIVKDKFLMECIKI